MDWDALGHDLHAWVFNDKGNDFNLVPRSPRGMEPSSLK